MQDRNYRLGLYEKAMPDFDSWEEKLELTRRSGFDWLEMSVDESEKKLARLKYGGKELAGIRLAISNSAVPISTMCLSGHRKYPLGSRDAGTRSASLEIMRRALDLSAELGIRLIQLAGYDVYYEQPGEDTAKYFAEGLGRAVELAAIYGVDLGFETMETPFMDTVEKSMTYVSAISSPYLGIYPDLGNLKNAAVSYGGNVTEDLRKGKGHIFAAHLKETSPGIYRDMFFGTGGHTEYVPCVKELWSQGVRMFTGEFWYHDELDYEQRLKTASEFLRGKIHEGMQQAQRRT